MKTIPWHSPNSGNWGQQNLCKLRPLSKTSTNEVERFHVWTVTWFAVVHLIPNDEGSVAMCQMVPKYSTWIYSWDVHKLRTNLCLVLWGIWGNFWTYVSVEFSHVFVDLMSLCGSLCCPVISRRTFWQRGSTMFHALDRWWEDLFGRQRYLHISKGKPGLSERVKC